MNLIDFICLAVFIWRIKIAVGLGTTRKLMGITGNHEKVEIENKSYFCLLGEYSDLHEARIGNQWQTGILYLKSVRYTHHE